MNKPKLHEISKQFGIASKELLDVLAKYNVTGKSYMSSLEPAEMNILLEYYTQKLDKGENIDEIRLAAIPKEAPAEKTAKPAEGGKKAPSDGKKEQSSDKPSSKKSMHYVDTRANAVDLEQQLKTEKAANLVGGEMRDYVTGKQKIKKNRSKGQKREASRAHSRRADRFGARRKAQVPRS